MTVAVALALAPQGGELVRVHALDPDEPLALGVEFWLNAKGPERERGVAGGSKLV